MKVIHLNILSTSNPPPMACFISNNDPRNGCQAYKSGYEDRFAGRAEQSEHWGIQRQYIFITVK